MKGTSNISLALCCEFCSTIACITQQLYYSTIVLKHLPVLSARLCSDKRVLKHLIYKIPCKDCSNVYIGEKGRCFNTRLSEHKRDLKPINLAKLKEDNLNKKTALVKHCFNCEHRIDFSNFEILDYNIDYDKRKFLESFYINNTKNSINDKDRNVFPKIYSNIKNLN